MAKIECEELIVGEGVTIEPSAKITGIGGPAKKIEIGDHCYIGSDVQIMVERFSMGDYCKIHHHTNIHGRKEIKIGHNAWIGQYCILDTTGGIKIGNNLGLGAHSQIWSHIKYGDTLEGCRFNSVRETKIGNDVWFVGHCIVSPIRAEDKSMALVGSVVTKDMKSNRLYAGTPAKDITQKSGTPFDHPTLEEKTSRLRRILADYEGPKKVIKIVDSISEINFEERTISFFDVQSRCYTKRNTPEEVAFMKFLLPEKAKFIPF